MYHKASVSDVLGVLFPVIIAFVTFFVITAVYGAARRKENALSHMRDGVFIVKSTPGLLAAGIFCLAVFGFFLALTAYAVLIQKTLEGGFAAGVFIVFGVFALMGAYLTANAARWRLLVGQCIVYTPTIGRSQVIAFEDIAYAVLSMNYLKVYDHFRRRIFTLQATCVGGATFIRLLQIKGIPFGRPQPGGASPSHGLQRRDGRRTVVYYVKGQNPLGLEPKDEQ